MSREHFSDQKEELSLDEGDFLVKLSRKAILRCLNSGEVIDPPDDAPKNLSKKRGVFVTLSSYPEDELRGCIGFPEPIEDLVKATITSAVEAATGDPRFPPVTLDELDHLIVEVSVLTTPEEIRANPKEIPDHVDIGSDGLIVGRGQHRGLLLPQVAAEWGWDREEFLANCCLKAGLPPDNWLLRDTRVFKFQATIFKEKTPRGSVERIFQEKRKI